MTKLHDDPTAPVADVMMLYRDDRSAAVDRFLIETRHYFRP
ncbi:hypothetical protein [Labrys sp. WJW]|nr:hypothetical protein [Labrys sp. WJW]